MALDRGRHRNRGVGESQVFATDVARFAQQVRAWETNPIMSQTAHATLAAQSGRSLGAVMDDALRVLLRGQKDASADVDWTFPTSGAGGLQPGVDLEDKDALADLLDR